jgi:hypothetical protein
MIEKTERLSVHDDEKQPKTSDLISGSFLTMFTGSENEVAKPDYGLKLSYSFHTSFLEVGAHIGLSSSESIQSDMSDISRKSHQDDSPIIDALGHRLDYCLKHKAIQTSLRQYVTGIRAHFNYWSDHDLAYHVLSTISSKVCEI